MNFSAAPPSVAEADAYVRGLRGSAKLRLGLLSNPMARTNWRSVGHAQLSPLLPDRQSCLETPSVDALVPALNYLLFQRTINLLVVNGGDGTIHHTLNAAVTATRNASAACGRPVPLPTFLFVNGGGMNMLARVFETRGHPVRTLRRFLKHTRGRRVGTLSTRAVPLLSVTEDSGKQRLGYIFGSELVFNALTMYERFGQGYLGLGRFLWAVGAGYTFRTELWNRSGHLLDAPETPLMVDETTFPRYTSLVATTVPLQLAKGVVGTFHRGARPGAFNAVAVLPTDKGEVIRTIPTLMRGAEGEGLVYHRDAVEARLHGAYTLDGERFAQGDSQTPLRVAGSQTVVRGVWLA